MHFRFSEEVRRAREQGAPLVALETSVVAQGLPWPEEHYDALRRAVEEYGRYPLAPPPPL